MNDEEWVPMLWQPEGKRGELAWSLMKDGKQVARVFYDVEDGWCERSPGSTGSGYYSLFDAATCVVLSYSRPTAERVRSKFLTTCLEGFYVF